MRRQAAFAAIVLCFVAATAHAAPRWTFCVAAAGGGADVWISDVFVVERDREKLEGAFKSAVGGWARRPRRRNARCLGRTRRSPSTRRSTPRRSTARSARRCTPSPRPTFRRGGSAQPRRQPLLGNGRDLRVRMAGPFKPVDCPRARPTAPRAAAAPRGKFLRHAERTDR